MFLRLCGPPSIPLSFSLAAVLPRWMTYRFPFTPEPCGPTASHHRLQCGLPGYLILFDPHTFVPQRRLRIREMPSQSVFCVISTHFTATPHIPPTASVSKPSSINGSPRVEPGYFTADLKNRLPHPLNPIIPDNARIPRITAAAGTELADAYSQGTLIAPSRGPYCSPAKEVYCP